ncbi:hypothetical protein LHYA1_G008987, partial [Lachnellula hyalina]
MATSTPPAPAAAAAAKCEWLVIIPDQPGKLAKRVEIRPKHFQGLTPKIESGFWKMGGLFPPPPPPLSILFSFSCKTTG